MTLPLTLLDLVKRIISLHNLALKYTTCHNLSHGSFALHPCLCKHLKLPVLHFWSCQSLNSLQDPHTLLERPASPVCSQKKKQFLKKMNQFDYSRYTKIWDLRKLACTSMVIFFIRFSLIKYNISVQIQQSCRGARSWLLCAHIRDGVFGQVVFDPTFVLPYFPHCDIYVFAVCCSLSFCAPGKMAV